MCTVLFEGQRGTLMYALWDPCYSHHRRCWGDDQMSRGTAILERHTAAGGPEVPKWQRLENPGSERSGDGLPRSIW